MDRRPKSQHGSKQEGPDGPHSAPEKGWRQLGLAAEAREPLATIGRGAGRLAVDNWLRSTNQSFMRSRYIKNKKM
jgi:hypothetical protein